MRPEASALRSVRVMASCPTTSSNAAGRYFRARTWYVMALPTSCEKSDRAPSVDRTVLRSPRRADSSQVLPRHTRGSPYRCSLPGLAGFDDSHCVGPNLQHRPTRLIHHGPPSRGDSTPLKRIAGYRAPLTPRLARPRRNDGGGGGI